MKVTCTQENFKKAIYSTERVVGKQIALPILENILLETEQGMLKVSATNLEIGVFLKIGAKIEEEGKITVPAKLLSNFVNNLAVDNTVSLVVREQTLQISSGSSKAQIKGLMAHDFPIIPEMEGEFLFSLAAQDVKENLSKLLSCVSLDNARPELSGINVIFMPREAHFAATDSFRLAEIMLPLEPKNQQQYEAFIEKTQSIIVPLHTLSEVFRVIGNDTENIQVSIEDSQIFFQVDNVRIVSRLINGKYPSYKQIIPQKFTTKIVLGKEDMLRAVKLAGIFTNNKTGEIHISADVKNGEINVQSKAEEVGENQTVLKAQIEGPEQKIIFNPRYVSDGMQAVTTDKLALLLNDGTSPAVLKMLDSKTQQPKEGFTYVIMPIKN